MNILAITSSHLHRFGLPEQVLLGRLPILIPMISTWEIIIMISTISIFHYLRLVIGEETYPYGGSLFFLCHIERIKMTNSHFCI